MYNYCKLFYTTSNFVRARPKLFAKVTCKTGARDFLEHAPPERRKCNVGKGRQT